MQFVIQQNFTAQPFISSNGIPLNVAPKDFIAGTTIDATEQMNTSRQMVWVSSDGYTIDMTKVSAALNPTVATPLQTTLPGLMNLQVVQGFTASPFIYDASIPSVLPPKMFVTGQHIEAQQRLNSFQQPVMVTTDGYVVNMSSVQQLNYPQYYPQQPPMGYYAPHPRYQQQYQEQQQPQEALAKSATLPVPAATGLFTKSNIIYLVIAILLIYFFLIRKPA